jgi:hypothetical protein
MAELRLDEATKKALIGLMPFSQAGKMDFTPALFDNIPAKARPVFKQRSYTVAERQEYRDVIFDEKITDKSTRLLDIVRRTVAGWDTVFDMSTGELMPFKADEDKGADKEAWGILPRVVQDALLVNVNTMSGLLPQERQGLKS